MLTIVCRLASVPLAIILSVLPLTSVHFTCWYVLLS